jgi:hypothetical protein
MFLTGGRYFVKDLLTFEKQENRRYFGDFSTDCMLWSSVRHEADDLNDSNGD